MKYLPILLCLWGMSSAWAKPLVLVTFYDPFDHASSNNSEAVAKLIEAKFNSPESTIELHICGLNTIFDKAFKQTENCLKELPRSPTLVLGLGEGTCQLKLETMMRNLDKTIRPDNAGNNRDETEIIPGAPAVMGMRYPLPQMYCGLAEQDRKTVNISNNAGNFVCNNTGYQMTYLHPEIQYGFIHVPYAECPNSNEKTLKAVEIIGHMIQTGTDYLEGASTADELPHSSNQARLPSDRSKLKALRALYQDQSCIYEYLKRSKAESERSLLNFNFRRSFN